MTFVCIACEIDPSLHSFRIHEETESHITYYSCISEATDTQVERVVAHIKGFLDKNNGKTWSWILDSRSFTVHWHTFEVTMALFDIITLYQDTITEIRITNLNSYMKDFVSWCVPYMRDEIKRVVCIE
jgi:hypothetical protein